jgi:hypothetical protein
VRGRHSAGGGPANAARSRTSPRRRDTARDAPIRRSGARPRACGDESLDLRLAELSVFVEAETDLE